MVHGDDPDARGDVMKEIAPGIHLWRAGHPEWRPTSEAVGCYALVCDDTLALIDPLLPAGDDPDHDALLTALDALAAATAHLEILTTIPYHTRSAETLFERYRRRVGTRLWGHPLVRARLEHDTPLETVPQGKTGTSAAIADGLALAFTIGSPRRTETPLYFPRPRALAFGDAIVGVGGGLRVWQWQTTKPGWYEQRFLPTLRPLLDLDAERVLVTHGEPVVRGGRAALAAALDTPPTAY
jgi:hypothetical protein